MRGWQKIDSGWYVHESGAAVQRWGNYNELSREDGWYAWRPGSADHDKNVFRTMREACEWCLQDIARE